MNLMNRRVQDLVLDIRSVLYGDHKMVKILITKVVNDESVLNITTLVNVSL